MQAEFARRENNTDRVLAVFRERPNQWISWERFFRISKLAWRTRIADARRIVQRDGGDILWNKRVMRSAYRFQPYRSLGPDAADVRTQRSLF